MSTTQKPAAAPADDPLAGIFAEAEQTAPPPEGFLNAAERHELVQRGTPLYIGAVAIQDGTYGLEIVYTLYLDPKQGETPEARKLSMKHNAYRENFARVINDALRNSTKAIGPVYLITEGGSSDRSPRYAFARTPQLTHGTRAVQLGDPDAPLRPF